MLAVCMIFEFASADQGSADQELGDFFESKIRPLLVEHCYSCHSVESGESNGNLLLDTAESSRKGGDRGPAVVPGNTDDSLLLKAVSYTDGDMEMPPSGKLSDEEIQSFRDWIASGAIDPRSSEGTSDSNKIPSPLARDPKTHWAFVPPKTASPPATIAADSRDVLDAAFSDSAAEHGVAPSGIADRVTLIRRLYFDLTGLTPRQEQIDAFIDDKHPMAYERLVDQLLATPEFGERFGRHWLDVARYADTVGYDFGGKDRRLVGSERYRDWVIRAFDADMPYDEMIRHQLSGDKTDPENAQGHLDAMGFLTVGRKFLNRLDLIDDRIDVITRGLLGLTVSCARCHDHKFDPVPTSDYYALAGIMTSSEQPTDGPSPLMMKDSPKPHDHAVLIRGRPDNRGDMAPRQFLTALRKPDEPRFTEGSGRSELVDRIVVSDNPLTYRVMANRVWTHLTGVPLVSTPSDFGFRTEAPAVPAVLDDLAAEFAVHRSVKTLVRRIVNTTTYQRSADAMPEMIERDPDNRFAMRGTRRRRDFESLRDSMLAVSESLERVVGGEPVDISVVGSRPRRTVYAFIDRQNPPGLFRTFDVASPDTHTPSRHYTTVPQQSLFLMNSPIVQAIAARIANRVTVSVSEGVDEPSELAKDNESWAKALFVRVLERSATEDELRLATEFLSAPLDPAGPTPEPKRLWQYGRAKVTESGSVDRFEALATFTDNRWQASPTYPDPVLHYAQLNANGGHPGDGLGVAVVRRWTAPIDGEVTLAGSVGHKSEHGDGIRATIAIGERVLWQEVVKTDERVMKTVNVTMKRGETLDLIVDDNGSTSHDTYQLRSSIRLECADGRVIEGNTADDFSGPIKEPQAAPQTRRGQLAQWLLLSNEFAFVD
jgi:hypothetical protein